MEKYSNSTPTLPKEFFIEVFCRLPVKTLVQLCCVCKFWKNLILSDHTFIRCHLKQSLKKTPRSISNVLMYYNTWDERVNPDFGIQRFINADVNCLRKPFFLGLDVYLVGCINGVFCFYEFWNCDIYLWNPALRQCRRLPYCKHTRYDVFGFVFEPTNDDYIVVIISSSWNSVQIYKLSSNSWETIDFPYHPSGEEVQDQERMAIVHNGALHWLSNSYRRERFFLNLYNLGRKTFQEFLIPDYVPFKPYIANLGLIKGRLCLFGQSTTNFKYEVWMMEEYGVEDSWIKPFEFPSYIIPVFLSRVRITSTNWKLVVKSKDDHIVLHNPENEEIEEFVEDEPVLCDSRMMYFFNDNYVESLVSVFPPNKIKGWQAMLDQSEGIADEETNNNHDFVSCCLSFLNLKSLFAR